MEANASSGLMQPNLDADVPAGTNPAFATLSTESSDDNNGRSISTEASRAPSLHSLSSVADVSRKSRHAEPGTTETDAGRASLMPPPASRLQSHGQAALKSSRPSIQLRRRESSTSEARSEDSSFWKSSDQASCAPSGAGSGHPHAAEPYTPRDSDSIPDLETPRLAAGANPQPAESENRLHLYLPDAAPWIDRQSLPDAELKRMSMGSSYSLNVPSSAASITGSENNSTAGSGTGLGHRAASGPMASGAGKGIGAPHVEAGLSNINVTTGSQGSDGVHQLTPREPLANHLNETMTGKRNGQSGRHDSMGASRNQPQQATRSRSRAQRRFSGSTAASSHSPGSTERSGTHRPEKEEVKPAPWGVIGVCALDAKARSKPSRNILNRLIQNREFDVCVFGDKVILDEEMENWPVCDYLISFYSDGFPLEKAIAYVKARKPFCVNDLPMQKILWDRRICLQILDHIGVPTPQRVEVTRDGGPELLTPDVCKHVREVSGIAFEPRESETTKNKVKAPTKVELLEDGDVLSVDGVLIAKPFVEKPISGEDHNIIIYFPRSSGGGARKLFRKIGNKSSEFVPDLVRPRAITQPDDSFIYEKFMKVDNAEDVKAYTVGPAFCHAETRKSPVVDGVVRRNTHGKEVRYVAVLTAEEKEYASKISTSFGQRVCGFDMLRAGRQTYVIDVNGWSFVKDNDEYYNQCASILKEMFIREKVRRSGSGMASPIPSLALSEADPMNTRGVAATKERDLASAAAAKAKPGPISTGSQQAGEQEAEERRASPGEATSTKSESASGMSTRADSNPSRNPMATSTMEGIPLTGPSPMPTTPPLIPDAAPEDSQTPPPPPPKHAWKLKGVVSVIRHADRTPKQKYKFTFHTKPFIDLLKGHQEEVLLIGEPALQSVINAVDIATGEGVEDGGKLNALRNVLVRKGGWAGTKVQIKPMFRKKKSEAGMQTVAETGDSTQDEKESWEKDAGSSLKAEHRPGGMAKREKSLSGTTIRSRFEAWEKSLQLDKLQLIVKWGGEPTHSARYQAQELGENMRNDVLLLNRDVLDETHVFSSSERRVTTSAQIWAASFLAQKEVPDDFITIRKDLLDDSNAAKDEMDKVKKKLKGLLRKDNERPPQFAWPENMPEPAEVQTRVAQLMNFHRQVMQYNYGKLQSGAVTALNGINHAIPEKVDGGGGGGGGGGKNTSSSSSSSINNAGNNGTALASALSQANAIGGIQGRWCCGEDAGLFRERWEKLFTEFCDGEKVDPSKISELYDTMKFDALHNRQFLEWVFTPPKQMLEEEYGKDAARLLTAPALSPATTGDKTDADEGLQLPSRKGSEDSKSERGSAGAGAGEKAECESSNAVKRLFRRTSFRNAFRIGFEPAEQYFHLHRGNSQTKAKTDARFEPLRELYQLAKVLFDFICPQEYGISDSEKLEIGLLTSLPLLKEIVQDLEEMQASDEAKSFIYFTKESHIYTLLNCILEGGIDTKIKRATIPELDYLSQISFELYESESKVPAGAAAAGADEVPKFAYSIRITISPGCHVSDPLDVQLDSRHCIGCAPRRSLTPHGDWKVVIETLRAKFHQVKLPKSFLAINLSDAFSFPENPRADSDAPEAVARVKTEAELASAREDVVADGSNATAQDGPATNRDQQERTVDAGFSCLP